MDSQVSTAGKEKREPMFQQSEKAVLIDLVTKYYSVVECKKTDAGSSKIKTEQWKRIAQEFNASSLIMEREWQSLKTLWENLKKAARRNLTEQKQNTWSTGWSATFKNIIMLYLFRWRSS